MSFRSVNEIDRFSFDECQIVSIKEDEVGIIMELEALIVMPNNSQNTNYTKSFAGTTTVRLDEGKIVRAYKEGYRRYDANDRLVEEIPDVLLDSAQLPALLKSFANCFLYRFDSAAEGGVLGIEVPAEDDIQGIESDIYRLEVSFAKAVFSWERYLNRVQE